MKTPRDNLCGMRKFYEISNHNHTVNIYSFFFTHVRSKRVEPCAEIHVHSDLKRGRWHTMKYEGAKFSDVGGRWIFNPSLIWGFSEWNNKNVIRILLFPLLAPPQCRLPCKENASYFTSRKSFQNFN